MTKAYFSKTYRTLVPRFIHKKLFAKLLLPDAIQKYYNSLSEPQSEEIETALKYLKTNPLTVFPHPFQDKYKAETVHVFSDRSNGLKYVLLDGKKLYYKRNMSEKRVQRLFNLALKEQDYKSPHRYLTNQFNFEQGSVVVDIGAAEGNFSLSVAEKASKIILFETDKQWIEALEATFAPWKHKVTIVNKFVDDNTTDNLIKLDDFLTSFDESYFLKVDVEGAEMRLIKGAANFISKTKNLKAIVCTYHKQNDQHEIDLELKNQGFINHFSDNYMLFYYDMQIGPPFFRRGLIRAEKTP